ncbi:MAG: hypothetical protein RLZZ399_498 [Verrucomicrobiota bacterium]
MAELADAYGSGPYGETRGGSSPLVSTTLVPFFQYSSLPTGVRSAPKSKGPENRGTSAALRSPFFLFKVLRPLIAGVVLLPFSGCHKEPSNTSTLPNSVYVWQQHWTPGLGDSVRNLRHSAAPIHQLIVLSAQIQWHDQSPTVFRPTVDWDALHESAKPIGLGIRIAPFHHEPTQHTLEYLAEVIRSTVAEAKKHGVVCEEVQLDYDSPQRRLDHYRRWLIPLREAARPLRFTITALPAWLGEPELPRLLREVDRFILQVHSVQTRARGELPALFEIKRAQRWIQRAGRFRHPFFVSLPTYSGLVGYSPEGRQLGMALDGNQPAWPPGTQVVEFHADPDAIASLVSELRKMHPVSLEGLAWYRLPSGKAERNWRWPTFAAVLEGRRPISKLDALAEGDSPVDLKLQNQGEAEEAFRGSVVLRWKGAALVDCEGSPGWTVRKGEQEVRWILEDQHRVRLSPGAQSVIGWARFNEKPPLWLEVDRVLDPLPSPLAPR